MRLIIIFGINDDNQNIEIEKKSITFYNDVECV